MTMTTSRGRAPSITAERARDYRDDAACRNEDPELFFPIGLSGPALLQAEQAKAVCRRCPDSNRAACLADALKDPHTVGVWGGTTEADRFAMALGQRSVLRNAAKTHCPQGHPYDEVNTGRGSRGERRCRACDNDRRRNARHTNAEQVSA